MESRTRLGRAVQSSLDRGQMPPSHAEDHGVGTSLRDVILGGQDGLVNLLGIALGVVAAGGSTNVLIAAGLAAAITESISVVAVAFSSSLSERDHYLAGAHGGRGEVRTVPESEGEGTGDI